MLARVALGPGHIRWAYRAAAASVEPPRISDANEEDHAAPAAPWSAGWRELPRDADDALERDPLAWWDAHGGGATSWPSLGEVRYADLRAPFPGAPPRPRWAMAVGLNYAEHAAETKMERPAYPILIGKAPSATVGPNEAVVIPKCADPGEVDYEAELAVVIGRRCRDVPVERALDVVLGFCAADDVSARKWQGPKRGGGQWLRAKSFDTFMPLGPVLRLAPRVAGGGGAGAFDPTRARVRTRLRKSGARAFEVTQDDTTENLIFGVAQLVSFASQDTTLEPWTAILTGTPAGVGYTRRPPVCLEPGDVVEVGVEGVGVLRNPVRGPA